MLWVWNKEKAPGDSREPLWQREKDSNPRRKRRRLRVGFKKCEGSNPICCGCGTKEKAPGDSREPLWQREKDSNPRRKRRGLRVGLKSCEGSNPVCCGCEIKKKLPATAESLHGSGRRIRTLTYGVRVRCATFTQSRYVPKNKNYYTGFTGFVNSFFLRNGFYFCAGRSAAVKYFFSGLYSSANITAHRIMLGSM